MIETARGQPKRESVGRIEDRRIQVRRFAFGYRAVVCVVEMGQGRQRKSRMDPVKSR